MIITEIVITVVLLAIGLGVLFKVTAPREPAVPCELSLPVVENGETIAELERGVVEKVGQVLRKAKELGFTDVEAELRKDEAKHDVNGSETMRAIGRKVADITSASKRI